MTKPMLLADFARLPPSHAARVVDGLATAIDAVAERARPSHRFLRFGWYAAAVAAYGGAARTLLVERDGVPVLALPFVATGPALLGLASVPGCYWPFRGIPARADIDATAFEAALATLARTLAALRIGPVYDGDPVVTPLLATARARGWAVIDRVVAQSHLLDLAGLRADGGWPRGSTLRKNRFHEKHLAGHGALDWSFASGAGWTPALFDDLAGVERTSWVATRTDGRDAKFTGDGHGAFWRAAAADPVLAEMMWAALLRVDGQPVAFSFDLNAGGLKYAVANGYDPALGKHSPGKLLYYRNLTRALDDGMVAVDWGAGDSGYKATIGAVPGPMIRDWVLVRPGAAALAARLAATVRGWAQTRR